MKIMLSIAALSLCTLAAVTVPADASVRDLSSKSSPELMCGPCFTTLDEAAKAVVSDDKYEATMARRHLRKAGVEGLKALRAMYANEIKLHGSKTAPEVVEAAQWEKISLALDEVAQQKNAWSQGDALFWFTSTDQAKAAAEKSGKPILSLRMLGKLTEDCSCANSRFFRTAFYANADVAKFMSDNFVLLWTSERPVPKVTVDMGDGRTMVFTITGNSAHYVMDAKGRVLDCIPGLYGPAAFKSMLERDSRLNAELKGKEDAEHARLLKLHHKTRHEIALDRLASDLRAAGIDVKAGVPTESIEGEDADFLRRSGAVPAEDASKRAMAKSRIERAFFVALGKYSRSELESKVSDEVWKKIAALHADECRLDEGSKKLMREQNPEDAAEASKRAMSKMAVEDPFFKLVRKFEGNIALDTVKNEYTFHLTIHNWFANGEVGTFEQLNERVYAELFHTPASDPWLGLKGEDYDGLDKGGIR